jgi:hypothetical protein
MRTISKRTQYGPEGDAFPRAPVWRRTRINSDALQGRVHFHQMPGADSFGFEEHNLLVSKKGPRGGYQLSRPPSTLTLGSLVRIMEGPLAPLPCASETAFRPREECEDVESCGTRIIMRQVRDATAGVLDRTTLADLPRQVESARAGKKSEALMYYI